MCGTGRVMLAQGGEGKQNLLQSSALAQGSGKDHSLIHTDKQLRCQSAPHTGSASSSTPPAPADPVSRQRAELERLHDIP